MKIAEKYNKILKWLTLTVITMQVHTNLMVTDQYLSAMQLFFSELFWDGLLQLAK